MTPSQKRRTRAASWAIALGGAALGLSLLSGALDAGPEAVRVVAAFTAIVLWPGFALVFLGARPPGSALFSPAWAMGLGVAWNAALVLLTRVAHLPFTVLVPWGLAAGAVLWTFALWRGGGPSASQQVGAADGVSRARWPRTAWLVVALACAFAAWTAGTLGSPLGFYSDSPDHIGTVRRMLASGDAFPTDAFFRDAGPSGADPRKGLWHPQVALVAKLSGADPVEVWRWIPMAIAPLFVLVAAAFGFLLGGPGPAALAAWAWVLTHGGSVADPILRQSAFSARMADILTLATATAALDDAMRPRPGSRSAALGLGLGAIATHIWAVLHFVLAFSGFGLALLLRHRGVTPTLKRFAVTALLLGAASLPYLLWRAGHAYAPQNILHTEPQGLLTIVDGVQVTSIGILWEWMGWLWILFPLCWIPLWRQGRDRPVVLYLFATSATVGLISFNPFAVAWLRPKLGYLLMRLIWLAPLSGLLAWLLAELVSRLRRAPRWGPALALAFVGALCVAPVRDGWYVLRHSRSIADQEAPWTPAAWSDALGWMKSRLPPGRVVLSDPTTSYSVPMWTGHYVVTLSDQHSSPNDARALQRLLDARDALDPYGSWDRTREVIRRYGVDVIALNNRIQVPLMLHLWEANPDWFAGARARLDRHPQAFERLLDTGDFVVYGVHPEQLDAVREPTVDPPFVVRFTPERAPIARRMGDYLPVLANLQLTPRVAAPGDTLQGVAAWRVLEPLPPASYVIPMRFDRELPGGLSPPRFLGKPVRKLLERWHGERYRLRDDHHPARGRYGVDRWRPDQVVLDSFIVRLPQNAAEGTFQVRIKMVSHPIYPNYRLSDYFFDDDYFAGVPVGVLRIQRPTGPGRRNH